MKKITTAIIQKMKNKEKITVLTAYDYSTAKIIDEAGIDITLVGDSLGMVVLGYDSTIPVTVEDMIHHAKAVVRGTKCSHVVVDMPFMSYHISIPDTLKNAARIMQETGADSVKVEGGKEIVDVVTALIKGGIPVMGHLGLLPQSVNQLGGYKVQGTEVDSANKLIDDAIALQNAGVYSIVLECIPYQLADTITKKLSIPTIGIGAGPNCDGQVLVSNDMLGIYNNFTPKFVKQYNNLYDAIKSSVINYKHDVKTNNFPKLEHSYEMSDELHSKLYGGK